MRPDEAVTPPPAQRRPDTVSRILASTLLAPFFAVVGVTVVLTALFVWRDGDLETRNASPVAAGPPASSPADPTTGPSPRGAPSAAPPTSGAPSVSPPTPTPAPTPSVTTKKGPPVAVVDQSGRADLAAAVAKTLRGKGWKIERVGDFRGNVRTTTVYYPDGQEAAAKAVAAELARKARTLPRFDTLSETSLTVVLTDDYPS